MDQAPASEVVGSSSRTTNRSHSTKYRTRSTLWRRSREVLKVACVAAWWPPPPHTPRSPTPPRATARPRGRPFPASWSFLPLVTRLQLDYSARGGEWYVVISFAAVHDARLSAATPRPIMSLRGSASADRSMPLANNAHRVRQPEPLPERLLEGRSEQASPTRAAHTQRAVEGPCRSSLGMRGRLRYALVRAWRGNTALGLQAAASVLCRRACVFRGGRLCF